MPSPPTVALSRTATDRRRSRPVSNPVGHRRRCGRAAPNGARRTCPGHTRPHGVTSHRSLRDSVPRHDRESRPCLRPRTGPRARREAASNDYAEVGRRRGTIRPRSSALARSPSRAPGCSTSTPPRTAAAWPSCWPPTCPSCASVEHRRRLAGDARAADEFFARHQGRAQHEPPGRRHRVDDVHAAHVLEEALSGRLEGHYDGGARSQPVAQQLPPRAPGRPMQDTTWMVLPHSPHHANRRCGSSARSWRACNVLGGRCRSSFPPRSTWRTSCRRRRASTRCR